LEQQYAATKMNSVRKWRNSLKRHQMPLKTRSVTVLNVSINLTPRTISEASDSLKFRSERRTVENWFQILGRFWFHSASKLSFLITTISECCSIRIDTTQLILGKIDD
jgi:hypothetical protein